MTKGESIIGRKKIVENDFYETPQWNTRLILDNLIKDKVLNPSIEEIYEPCCGAGAIADVLVEYGFKCRASDIADDDFIVGGKGVDVYKLHDKCCETVFTNPPYNLMTKNNMLDEFLRISSNKVILLLNVYFLASEKRKEILQNSPLKYIYYCSKRVTMYPYGEEKPKNDGTKMYCWCVWEHGYMGEPISRWI